MKNAAASLAVGKFLKNRLHSELKLYLKIYAFSIVDFGQNDAKQNQNI